MEASSVVSPATATSAWRIGDPLLRRFLGDLPLRGRLAIGRTGRAGRA